MTESGKMFSESWYRVAGQRLALRPQVKVRRQYFRGEKWYVLQDPFNNQFYRLTPASYRFVARLQPDRTVESVWKECLEADPDGAPGQEDVIQLLAQLYHANLLLYESPADSAKLFERYKKRKQRELQSRLTGIMFARFPLLDPDDFLKRLLPFVGRLFSPVGLVLWLAVVLGALKIAVDHFSELVDQGQAVLAPGNLFLLYIALVLLKTLHEFGHGFACRRFGGEVHVMGVMLMIFTPIPYVDATAAWAFRNRWHRALVGAAGMIVEVFLAALAAIAWANTGPGTLHSLSYNMMFIASVSTLLFNGNPLLRYDGYYILSDLLEIPNLHVRSRELLRYLVERHAFGWKKGENPARTRREQWTIGVFAVASGIYRLVVFTAIIFFVADQFLLAGLLMAAVCVVSWGVVPLVRFVNYLASNPRLERTRLRAIGVTVGTVALIFVLLRWVPFPYAIKAPGIVKTRGYVRVATEAPGYLARVLAPPGSRVASGDALVLLKDDELAYEIAAVEARLTEARAYHRRAMQAQAADLAPLAIHIDSLEQRRRRLEVQREALTVKAPGPGLWVSPDLEDHLGSWRPRGAYLGDLVGEQGVEFTAIVSQQDASRLFGQNVRRASVRFYGQADAEVPARDFRIIPAEQETLPSAALGWHAGGDVRTAMTDTSGLKTAEPFFQVVAELAPAEGVAMLHGRSGRVCFRLKPEPLLLQWMRQFRQMLQKRYQL
jgi:putative peptide zinc metalloprotease protein